MRSAIAAVWAAILCSFFIQTANALQTELIGLKADSLFASSTIGLVMAGYYAGYLVTPLASRVLIARYGHVFAVILAMAIAALAILLQPLILSAVAWALFRLLSGFALSLSYVGLESWINDRVADRLRGRVFSLYLFAQLLGMTAAQALLGLGTTLSYGMFALTAVLFLFAAIPVLMARKAAPSGTPPSPLGLFTMVRLAPAGVIATLLAGFTWAVLATFGPLYAKRTGLDMTGIGLFMAASVIGGGAVQMPVGWVSDHWGRRNALLLLFGGGTSAALLAPLAEGFAAGLAAMALMGAFIFPIYGVAVAAVNDHVAKAERVAAAVGLVLLFGIGSIFGPALCGVVMGAAGPDGFFWLLAASMAAGLAAALFAKS